MAQLFWLLSLVLLVLRRTAALNVSSSSNSTLTSSHISTSGSEAAAILSGIGGSPATTATLSTVSSSSGSTTISLSSASSSDTISNGSYSIPPTKTHVFTDPSAFTVHPNATNTRQATQAMQCWSSIITWSKSSQDWYNSDVATHKWPISLSVDPQILSSTWTSVNYPSNASVYTLCDGVPRANGVPKTTSGIGSTSYTPHTVSREITPTFRPQPCEATPDNCRFWYQYTNILSEDEDALLSQCGNPAHGVGDCLWRIQGDVQLYYFPVTTANDSFCSSTRPTITQAPTATVPNVMTMGNYTFTSGYAYIRVSSLWAGYDDWSQRIGPSFNDIMLTLKSEDVSTQCQGDFTNTPMNFADLNWPVPARAYSCQDPCGYWSYSSGPAPTQCSTIWSNVNPWLAIPTKALKELVPEWSTCIAGNKLQPMYWFDPPVVLEHVASVASPTAPTVLQTDPAAPQASPKSPIASQTAPTTSNSVVTQPPTLLSSSAPALPASSSVQKVRPDPVPQSEVPNNDPQPSNTIQQPQPASPPQSSNPNNIPTSSLPSSTIANIILDNTQTLPAIAALSDSAVLLGSLATLSQNQALTLSNIPISLQGTNLIVGSTQFAVPPPSPTSSAQTLSQQIGNSATGSEIFATGRLSITAPVNSDGGLQIDVGQTLLSDGAPLTVSEGVLSLGSGGLVLVPSATATSGVPLKNMTFTRVGGNATGMHSSLPLIVTSFPSKSQSGSVWTGDVGTSSTAGGSSGGPMPTVTMGSGARTLREDGRRMLWVSGVIGAGVLLAFV